jgi:hypothetical protein
MRSPLNNNTGGTGQYSELTKATSRSLTFGADEADTLSWNMPGNHPETARITPLQDDILVWRGDEVVQRFRVVSRQLSKDSGVLTASFSAVSYRALLDAWIFHESDTRSWATPTEQSLIAWTILSQGQARPGGTLGIVRGNIPGAAVNRVLLGTAEDSTNPRPAYFMTGMKRGEAITNIGNMINGFEWDIRPSFTNPYTQLRFDCWNVGTRNQHGGGTSPLVLDDGGTMMSWTHTVTPSEYGNVGRFTGQETTGENDAGTTPVVPITPVWRPGEDPTLPAPEGRWERDINNGDFTTQAAVTAWSVPAFSAMHDYLAEVTAVLKRGRWTGPTQLWIGDSARFIITERVTGSTLPDEPEYILYLDEVVRITQISIAIDELGAEDVSVALNRKPVSTSRDARTLNDRLTRLERR